MLKYCATVLSLLLTVAHTFAGELPEAPDEMQYPNIVKPIIQYKAWGFRDSELNDPADCRYQHDGTILISDSSNHAIKKYNPANGKLEVVPLRLPERFHGQFYPVSADTDTAGNFYVLNRNTRSILKFTGSGSYVSAFPKKTDEIHLNNPVRIAISDQRIAVADSGADRVVVYSLTGELLKELGKYGQALGEFNSPESVAFRSDGTLYVLDSYNNRVQIFDRNYEETNNWGTWGSFKGFLANPSDIQVTTSGEVFITDLLNHRVQVFQSDGTFKYQFGRHPPKAHEGGGRLHYPTSVSVSPDYGTIAVCEPFESRIQIFALGEAARVTNVNDSAWWEKGTKFHYGSKVAASANFLAVSEPDTHAILFFNLDGTTTTLAQIAGGQGSDPGQFIRPSGLAIDEKNDRLLVSDAGNRRVQEFTLAKTVAPKLPPNNALDAKINPTENLGNLNPDVKAPAVQFKASFTITEPTAPRKINEPKFAAELDLRPGLSPSAIHISPNGETVIADPDNNRLVVVDDQYQIKRSIASRDKKIGALDYPLDFSYSKDGKFLFVVDHYNYRIVKFTTGGKAVKVIGGSGSKPGRFVLPFGITSGQDGFVYVTDVGGQRVEKFTENGVFVSQWGSWGTGPGEFYKPKGITQLGDGTLVVVDFGNHRAQMFDASGKFIRIFGIENAVVTTVSP